MDVWGTYGKLCGHPWCYHPEQVDRLTIGRARVVLSGGVRPRPAGTKTFHNDPEGLAAFRAERKRARAERPWDFDLPASWRDEE